MQIDMQRLKCGKSVVASVKYYNEDTEFYVFLNIIKFPKNA